MRKSITLLLLIAAVFCVSAAAEEDAADAVRADLSTQLASYAESQTGWTKLVLSRAEITSVTPSGDGWEAVVSLPDLSCGVKSNEQAGSDAQGWLERALASYISGGSRTEVKLTAAVRETSRTVAWDKNAGPRTVVSKAKKLAAEAKKSYPASKLRIALEAILLPDFAELPEEKPREKIVVQDMPAYGALVAEPLGVSADCAARRLPVLLAMTDVASVGKLSDGLASVPVTLRVKDWSGVPSRALEDAKTALDAITGAPEMTRDELDRVLCANMSAAFHKYYYTKSKTNLELTVDLTKLVSGGPTAVPELMDYFRTWMKAMDGAVDELAAYAATRPFYAPPSVPASSVLTGSADSEGCRVLFDTGSDYAAHAFIRVLRGGGERFTAFIGAQYHLQLTMQPGEYTVFYGRGEGWYGEKYLFGEDGEYGRFTLIVPEAERISVHLSRTAGGNIPLELLTVNDVLGTNGSSENE